jgi:hypothetical protein
MLAGRVANLQEFDLEMDTGFALEFTNAPSRFARGKMSSFS